jgi:hypothetical protein
MFRCQRRFVADPAKELYGSHRLKPVAVLRRHFMMEDGFIILKVEAVNFERGDICVDGLWSAGEAQQNVSRDIVAQRNG